MGLFDFLKSKKKPRYRVEICAYKNGKKVELKENPVDPDWENRIMRYQEISSTLKPYEDIMIGFAVALRENQSLDNEIELLTLLIKEYNEIEQICVSRGAHYVEYFNDNWAKIRKGQSDEQGYIEKYEKRLDYLKTNYKALKQQEDKKKQLLPDLEKNVLQFIERNQPILQSEIYKSFDVLMKDDIRDILYSAAKKGIINREKQGRTYLIIIV